MTDVLYFAAQIAAIWVLLLFICIEVIMTFVVWHAMQELHPSSFYKLHSSRSNEEIKKIYKDMMFKILIVHLLMTGVYKAVLRDLISWPTS